MCVATCFRMLGLQIPSSGTAWCFLATFHPAPQSRFRCASSISSCQDFQEELLAQRPSTGSQPSHVGDVFFTSNPIYIWIAFLAVTVLPVASGGKVDRFVRPFRRWAEDITPFCLAINFRRFPKMQRPGWKMCFVLEHGCGSWHP